MDDSLARRKKEEDLIFQNMDEKATLRKQAVAEERAAELYRKIDESGVSKETVFHMLAEDRPFSEVLDWLDARIFDKSVQDLMAARAEMGRPITEEDARQRVRALMASRP
jgi:hypothetical protein